MPQVDRRAIIIVSDLHLSAGYDPQRGAFDLHERFFYDAAFARFLDYLHARALAEHRPWRLLLLGDTFDFPRVRTAGRRAPRGRPETSIESVVAKLNRIAEGHPRFFEALAGLVSCGVPLDIVPGNHDVELMNPPVLEHLESLLARSGKAAGKTQRIGFHPWIYHVPGVLYAEHGHQYHDINWFATLLWPSLTTPGAMDPPIGAVLDEFVLEVQERVDRTGPMADGPTPADVTWHQALREQPSLVLKVLPAQARFLVSALRHVAQSPARRSARRKAYRETAVLPHAAEVGLSPETVAAIDDLATTIAMGLRSRLIRALIVEPVLRRLRRGGSATGAPIAPRARYLHHAALAVHQLLRAEGKDVPYYVFGHSHLAEQRRLVGPDIAPSYLNPGSWTVSEPTSPALRPGRTSFTFVEIGFAPGTGAPIARVMRWDDAAGRAETLAAASSDPLDTP